MKILDIYKKYREPLLYLIVGGLTTAVSFGAQWFFSRKVGLSPVFLVTAISWVCAVTFAFFLDKLLVFKSISLKPSVLFKEAMLFYGARLISGAFESISMGILCDVFGMYDMLAKVFISFFVIIMNYIFSKFFIFKKKKQNNEEPNAQEPVA